MIYDGIWWYMMIYDIKCFLLFTFISVWSVCNTVSIYESASQRSSRRLVFSLVCLKQNSETLPLCFVCQKTQFSLSWPGLRWGADQRDAEWISLKRQNKHRTSSSTCIGLDDMYILKCIHAYLCVDRYMYNIYTVYNICICLSIL